VSDNDEACHPEKMARRKQVQDAEVAGKTIEKGLRWFTPARQGQVHHSLRAGAAHVGAPATCRRGAVREGRVVDRRAERAGRLRAAGFPAQHGRGFTWETQGRARDIAAARRAWDRAPALMAEPHLALLVLDELNIALCYDYLPEDEVVPALLGRRADLHVIVTGRNARPSVIEAADLVTEMVARKHHFAAGVKAQEEIEF